MLQQNSHVGNMWEQESEQILHARHSGLISKGSWSYNSGGRKSSKYSNDFLLTVWHWASEGFVLIGSCREKHYICYLRRREIKLRDKQKALDEISPAKSLLWSVQEHTNAPKQADIWNQCKLLHYNVMGTENKAKTLWLNIQTHTCSWK